jgi:hypothetical protein
VTRSAAQRRAQQQREQREQAEDQRRGRRRHLLQPPVQERDEDAELARAERGHRPQVARWRALQPAQPPQREGQQAHEADRVAQQRQRERRHLQDDGARRHDRGADQHAGAGGREQGPVQSFSSQVSATSSRPKAA